MQRIVDERGVTEGQALVFVRGSTAAIATMEFEPGGVHDLREMLERLIPTRGDYRAQPRSTTTPTRMPTSGRPWSAPRRRCRSSTARLATGTWQQIVLIDFDDRPRERTVVVQVVG